ncbi:MAG TPA: hypothetical protein VJB94_04550 [Candidatus Nanoarchaeia archaeon]|nr:hypothetical protein [Candidatus Nanoarchaeia archaeon]
MIKQLINYIVSFFKKKEEPSYYVYFKKALNNYYEMHDLTMKEFNMMQNWKRYDYGYYAAKLGYYKERIEFLQEKMDRNLKKYKLCRGISEGSSLAYKTLDSLVSV